MEVTIIVESNIKSGANTNVDAEVKSASSHREHSSAELIDKHLQAELESLPKVKKDVKFADNQEGARWNLAALAKFIMVAKISTGPVRVPRLKLNSKREESIFAAGEERNAARLARARQSLFKEPPTASESLILHQLFLSSDKHGRDNSRTASTINSYTAKSTDGVRNIVHVSIRETALTTTKLCHPQERNIHNLVFGGYLMREAFELGFTCGQLFCRSRLHFLAVDELAFKHPVPIGAVLQLTAHVVYTQLEFLPDAPEHPASQLIHIEVAADVLDIESGDSKTTNTFHFTFRKESPPVCAVKPATYSEAMKFLEGKRRISAAPLDPHGTIYKF
jgi:acyl-coenzyme A thioesterase 9